MKVIFQKVISLFVPNYTAYTAHEIGICIFNCQQCAPNRCQSHYRKNHVLVWQARNAEGETREQIYCFLRKNS